MKAMNNPEQILHRFIPNGQLDRDHVQKELSDEFVALLFLRGEKTPDEVAEAFARRYAGQLSWLGEARQDEILRRAVQETKCDLSRWLGEE